MREIDKLQKEIQELETKLSSLRYDLSMIEDGYIYTLTIYCYGIGRTHKLRNEHCAQELLDEYDGGNGIVEVETNNHEFAKRNKGHWGLNGRKIKLLPDPEFNLAS